MKEIHNTFTIDDIEKLRPNEKVGIISCINPQGEPHISLITSLMPIAPDKLALGQFTRGLSKKFIQETRNISFAMITLDQWLWTGKAVWTHFKDSGPEYEIYNNMPMFRYNAYFGIHRAHYFDLVDTSQGAPLPMVRIARSVIATLLARGGAGVKEREEVIPEIGVKIFNTMGSLKFVSYIGKDGFPVLIPALQCQAAGSRRVVFSPGYYGKELKAIPEGSRVAVFAMTLDMEDILVRGTFLGFSRHRGIKLGVIDIDWVYNSLPPVHGQIYPKVDLTAVTNF